MATKTFKHALYPDVTISLALFRDLQNAREIKQAVVSRKFDASLIKAVMVIDPFLVLVAANKAIHASRQGKMTTKSVHSEILFNISPSRKITEAFRKFGIDDGDESVLVAVVQDNQNMSACNALQSLQDIVTGKQVDISELSSLADLNAIKKEYKLSDTELSTCSTVDALASRIAAKDIITL